MVTTVRACLATMTRLVGVLVFGAAGAACARPATVPGASGHDDAVVAPGSAAPASSDAPPAPAPLAPSPMPAPPRVQAGEAAKLVDAAFARLSPALPAGARLAPATQAFVEETRAWTVRVVWDTDTDLGTLFVDDATGAVTFAPNDGRAERVSVDAFVARRGVEEKAVAAVAAAPIVKTLCGRARAQKARCSLGFDEHPTDADCGKKPALASDCWLRVTVQELHPTHASRLGTFLVEPGTYRVVGASGYCGPVPIASYRGPGTGCSM